MVRSAGVGFIYIRYFDIFSQIHARRPSAGLRGLDPFPSSWLGLASCFFNEAHPRAQLDRSFRDHSVVAPVFVRRDVYIPYDARSRSTHTRDFTRSRSDELTLFARITSTTSYFYLCTLNRVPCSLARSGSLDFRLHLIFHFRLSLPSRVAELYPPLIWH